MGKTWLENSPGSGMTSLSPQLDQRICLFALLSPSIVNSFPTKVDVSAAWEISMPEDIALGRGVERGGISHLINN